MILAAGKGIRLQPLTNSMPKVLLKIGGITMLEHQINYLRYYGTSEIIINVHHFADDIIKFIKYKKYDFRIEFSDEKEQLLETGGGLKKASWFFDDGKPFILMGADMYTTLNLAELVSYHKKQNPLATLAVKKRKSTREFLVNNKNLLCGWRNNITGEEIRLKNSIQPLENYGFSVIHVLNPEIFNHIKETGAFSMTTLYLRLAKQHPIMAYPCNDAEWYEFGRLENLNDEGLVQKAERIIEFYK